eukprot:scaffold189179_cov32-Tisochrysis_lutea.AAC.1
MRWMTDDHPSLLSRNACVSQLPPGGSKPPSKATRPEGSSRGGFQHRTPPPIHHPLGAILLRIEIPPAWSYRRICVSADIVADSYIVHSYRA